MNALATICRSVIFFAIPLAFVFGVAADLGASSHEGAAKYSEDGALIRPEGYREWIFVGAPLTPNDMNDGKATFPEFHSVYMDPGSYAEYKKTGIFRNGTVLVKELISVGSKKAPSGNGYFMGEFLGLETTIKDSKRFPKEPGNWAYFSFGKRPNLAATARKLPAAACNLCHDQNAAEDWVFSQYYPILGAAKPGK